MPASQGEAVAPTHKGFSAQYQAIQAKAAQTADLAQAGHSGRSPKMLAVLLCYNDADILADVIEHMLINNHDLILWDHGSTDATAAVIARYKHHIAEHRFIPRTVDFYGLYQAMSQHLIDHWVQHYDWISWPDQDEILEGPDRSLSYAKHIEQVYRAGYDWLVFNNINYWWTHKDAQAIASPIRRVRHYSIFPDCAPRVRAWRAAKTNIRQFNHNAIDGRIYEKPFNLRHYPMRSEEQMVKRITKDRAGLQRGNMNYHYNHMAKAQNRLIVGPDRLNYDDGVAELQLKPTLNWREIYGDTGYAP